MVLDNYSIGVILTQILSRWTRLVSQNVKALGTIDVIHEVSMQSVDNTKLEYYYFMG